jgi:hypothetical protein
LSKRPMSHLMQYIVMGTEMGWNRSLGWCWTDEGANEHTVCSKLMVVNM